MAAREELIQLANVVKTYRTRGRTVRALQNVDLTVETGQTVALIGESGSGKSTLGAIALGLTRHDSGDVRFAGEPWGGQGRDARARRAAVSIVYQDPSGALDPRMTAGASVLEPVRLHMRDRSKAEQVQAAREALRMAHLPPTIWSRYPRELSGGQQQRVSIARAIVTEPRFILLDEPTASLDASVRAGLLDTLRELQQRLSLSYLVISHDIATIRQLADQVFVLYRGVVVERGATKVVLDSPQHPYTRALIDAELMIKPRTTSYARLTGLPALDSAEEGCVLYGRCPMQTDECVGDSIALRLMDNNRQVACVRAGA